MIPEKSTRALPDDRGTAAWAILDRTMTGGLYYGAAASNLAPQIVTRARAAGWVMRARVKVVHQKPLGNELCHFTYRDGIQSWLLRMSWKPDGSQAITIRGDSSLGKNAVVPIADSRDRYVDYELRFHPTTSDVDVFVDGRLLATAAVGSEDDLNPEEREGGPVMLRFGTGKSHESEMRVALIEWGILDEATKRAP
jgi:hypothetical protein